jgi:hypothetical protein
VNTLATVHPPLPDIAQLRPRHQMAMDSTLRAVCWERVADAWVKCATVACHSSWGLCTQLPRRQISHPDHGVAMDHRRLLARTPV